MREIKFRAWDCIERLMNHGEELNNGDMAAIDFQKGIIFSGDPETYKARDFTLMQYTGLKDKNGKEIYEGDIVRFVPRSIEYPDVTFLYEVVWFESSPGFLFKDLLHFDNYDSPEISYQDRLTVIGNIYENSELMGKP